MNKRKMADTWIVCVDSDGCAMDTMNVKHIQFFGPSLIEIYQFKQKDKLLAEWNHINLYAKTRGINRFLGLVELLKYAIKEGENVAEIDALIHWTATTNSLSNQGLEQAIATTPDTSLEQALAWSKRVNEKIESELVGKDKPFKGVKEALQEITKVAEVGIVSSANREALDSEWQRHDLIQYVEFVYGQEMGSKTLALKDLIAQGYKPERILMIGDSPGDEKAAEGAGTYFYPILFGEEEASWRQFIQQALPTFVEGMYYELNLTMKEIFYTHLEQ